MAMKSFWPRTNSLSSAASSGVESFWWKASSWASSAHSTPSLRPTPRGSKLTRSYRVRSLS
jgi:hypothetical protein